MTGARRALPIVALMVVGLLTAPPSGASGDDVAINGTFIARSDGLMAKTREVFAYEADVTATWIITSSCTTWQDCTGTVVSSQGWTEKLVLRAEVWRVTHTVPDWEPCPDGSTAPGAQSFTFWPTRQDAPDRLDRLSGFDETVGPSGACGVNRWLTIRMPFTLTRAP